MQLGIMEKKRVRKSDAYIRWKNGEVPVIVATRAFGLGINKQICY